MTQRKSLTKASAASLLSSWRSEQRERMEGSRTAERKRRRFRFFVAASDKNRDRRAISTTGTGFGDERELRGNRPCVTS
jgi:hypothetical protein